jgi:piezo-type mechanosensitive ion channel component 1/2
VIELPLENENVTLSYSCQNYWALNVNRQGLLFITFSDLISDNLFDATSILGFYFGVAVIVGQTLRKIVMFDSDRIIITEIPDPDPIRNLIKAIYMQRLEQNLKKEEELWFILVEIMRSPEMIKAICGSSLRAPLVQKKIESQ